MFHWNTFDFETNLFNDILDSGIQNTFFFNFRQFIKTQLIQTWFKAIELLMNKVMTYSSSLLKSYKLYYNICIDFKVSYVLVNNLNLKFS